MFTLLLFALIVSDINCETEIDRLFRISDEFWNRFGAELPSPLFAGRSNYNNRISRCTTPNGERALCVSLFTCPVLMKALGTLQPFAVNFVKGSLCASAGATEDVFVCCGSSGNFAEFDWTNVAETSSTGINPTAGMSTGINPTAITTKRTTETSSAAMILAEVITEANPTAITSSESTTETNPAAIMSTESTIGINPTTITTKRTTETSSAAMILAEITTEANLTPIMSSESTTETNPAAMMSTESTTATSVREKPAKAPSVAPAVAQERPNQTESAVESRRDYVKRKLLPSRRYCGYQHTDDRVYNDSAIALDEYPWLVHLIFIEDEEEDTEQYLDRCNGVLLNKRYVLTTKFCGYLALRARLGQYDTNKTIVCNQDPHLPECSEPIIEIDIAEEKHRFDEAEGWHDFTLLRLAKSVTYTDFVRPICLPFEEYNLKQPSRLYLTGWGGLRNEGMYKKRLVYKIGTTDACFELDDKGLKDQTGLVTPVCAVPERPGGELACTGDQAGPFLFSVRHQWFVDSIVTRVYSKLTDTHYCSNELPIAGIKITRDVLDWILDNIRN